MSDDKDGSDRPTRENPACTSCGEEVRITGRASLDDKGKWEVHMYCSSCGAVRKLPATGDIPAQP